MSSILKALKKVETGPDKDGVEYQMPAMGGQKSRRGIWGSRRVLAATALLALLIGFIAAVGLLKMKTKATKDAKALHAAKKVTPIKIPRQSTIIKKQSDDRSSNLARKQKKPPVPTVKKERPKPIKRNDASPETQKKPVKAAKSRMVTSKDARNKMDDKSSRITKKPPVSSQKKQPEKKGVAYLFRDDPRVELQALVWSPDDPGARFVMINNQMIREGESSGNLRVLTINENDVVFSDGNNRWREKFKIN